MAGSSMYVVYRIPFLQYEERKGSRGEGYFSRYD